MCVVRQYVVYAVCEREKNGSFLALRARTFLVTLKCRFGPKKQTAVANDNDDVSYNNDIKANQITC